MSNDIEPQPSNPTPLASNPTPPDSQVINASGILLKTFRGVEIRVTPDGRFSALLPGETKLVIRMTLSLIEADICRKVEPRPLVYIELPVLPRVGEDGEPLDLDRYVFTAWRQGRTLSEARIQATPGRSAPCTPAPPSETSPERTVSEDAYLSTPEAEAQLRRCLWNCRLAVARAYLDFADEVVTIRSSLLPITLDDILELLHGKEPLPDDTP